MKDQCWKMTARV